MCCLFGTYDYKGGLTAAQKRRLISSLATASEARGTDATGIAYTCDGHLTVYKRPWPAHLMRFRLPETIRRSFYSSKSLRDAKKKAEAFQRNYEIELMVEGTSVIRNEKFSTWALSCLETYKRPYVKPNTYAGTYLAPVQLHLIPAFGNMKIADIKPLHIQRYINQAAEKYAPETVKKDYNCLKLIFDTAVDNQLCAKSPMTRSIKLPKYETVKDKHAFSQAQYDTAYAAAQAHGNLSLMLMLETGISLCCRPMSFVIPGPRSGSPRESTPTWWRDCWDTVI